MIKNGSVRYLLFLIAALIFCGARNLCAQENYKVVDGDSLEQGQSRIRLIDIDAPELFQKCYDENDKTYDCGKVALKNLKKYITKETNCHKISVDRYKRKLMECFDADGQSINRKMVLDGWAVSYGDKFIKEENMAKNQKIGIWRGRFMRPELYRALHMKQKNSKKFKKR